MINNKNVSIQSYRYNSVPLGFPVANLWTFNYFLIVSGIENLSANNLYVEMIVFPHFYC